MTSKWDRQAADERADGRKGLRGKQVGASGELVNDVRNAMFKDGNTGLLLLLVVVSMSRDNCVYVRWEATAGQWSDLERADGRELAACACGLLCCGLRSSLRHSLSVTLRGQ